MLNVPSGNCEGVVWHGAAFYTKVLGLIHECMHTAACWEGWLWCEKEAVIVDVWKERNQEQCDVLEGEFVDSSCAKALYPVDPCLEMQMTKFSVVISACAVLKNLSISFRNSINSSVHSRMASIWQVILI